MNSLAGVEEEQFALPVLRLGLVQEQDDAGRGRVVEEIFRQVDHAFDQVLLDEPAADVFFLVRVCVPLTAGGGASVEHHGGAALSLQAGEDVLHPAPIGLAAGKARALGKRSSSSAS